MIWMLEPSENYYALPPSGLMSTTHIEYLLQFSHSSNNPRDDIATEAYEDELDMGRSGSYLNSSINSAWSEHSLDPEDIRVMPVFCLSYFRLTPFIQASTCELCICILICVHVCIREKKIREIRVYVRTKDSKCRVNPFIKHISW